MSDRRLDHPVWEVYDLLRTARLNVLYYERRLQTTERLTTASQVLLAGTVPSSAIAGFEIWDFGLGKYAWEILASLSAIVAFLLPFLALPKKVKRYRALVDGYKIIFHDLHTIRRTIEQDACFGTRHIKMLEAAIERRKALDMEETGLATDTRARIKCAALVKKEFPAKHFYIPSGECNDGEREEFPHAGRR